MTYDVCLGTSRRAESATVLVTTTTQEAADRITKAIEAARVEGQLFQCEGLVAFSRGVDRMVAGEPLVLTEAQRAELPKLEPLADGPVAYAFGIANAPSSAALPADEEAAEAPTSADRRRK